MNSLWIVDGQHRLYGYSKVKDYSKLNQPKIPLSLIVNKSEVEQGSIFITINTNQTVLSDDYKWDLYGVYKDNFKRNVSALTPKYLNKLSNLNGKIYIPSMSPVRIKGNIGISKIGRTIYEQPKLFYGNLDDNRPNPQKKLLRLNVISWENRVESRISTLQPMVEYSTCSLKEMRMSH